MDIIINNDTAVIFDLDDTMYNEVEYLKSAYKQIAREVKSQDWKTVYACMFSLYRNGKDVFEWLENEFEVSKKDLILKYRQHQPEIKALPGLNEFLSKIKEKGAKIGILSDGRTATQYRKIQALGFTDLADLVIISEEFGSEKPNTANYSVFTKKFEVNTYYYIADNTKKDFVTPNKMGWQTLGLLDNGLNIHTGTYLNSSISQMPQRWFLSYAELNVVS